MAMMKIFLDTDFGPDCDDAAALTILLQLCREKHAELIGISHATGDPYGLTAIDTVCRLFGVNVPMGTCNNPAFLAKESDRFTRAMTESFPHQYAPDKEQPDAVDAFVQSVSNQPDHSVTIIGIGPMVNLARFCTEPVSAELMNRKVERIVLMAGTFVADNVEWNVQMDIPAMRTLVRHWNGRLELSPFEAFADVLTGRSFVAAVDNPTAVAYRIFTEGTMLRSSWDPGTIACTVLGPREPLCWSGPGILTVDEEGHTRFSENESGLSRILLRNGGPEQPAEWLEEIMTRATETMTQKLLLEATGT